MEAVNFREQFYKECYVPSLQAMVEKISGQIGNREDVVLTEFVKPLRGFISRVLEHQEKEHIPAVKHICISFLRTSVYLQKPVLLVEAYEEIPFLEKPVMSCELDAAWLLEGFKDFTDGMKARREEQILGRYVRNPEIKSYHSRAVSAMLRYYVIFLKPVLRTLELERTWNGIGTTDDFVISFGEYLDWQVPLIVFKKPIDIFLCDEKEDLTFRRFHEIYYEGKTLESLQLDDCVFENCVFRNTFFSKDKIRNVRFIECVFEECRFCNAWLSGSSFLSCRMQNVEFENCKILDEFSVSEKETMFYSTVEFKWSLMEKIRFINTKTRENIYVDCQLFDVTER
ncbi:MAG: pentapeptide repeat-containing protein [Lachnospiraceae bacterium]